MYKQSGLLCLLLFVAFAQTGFCQKAGKKAVDKDRKQIQRDGENKLQKLYTKTTANNLSEYARDVILKDPVNILYRNQSADDFLAEMILLKKELNAIGNNFNQAVHKLHTLDHTHDIKAWAVVNETSKKIFLKKTDEINEKLQEIYELWLQK